MSDAEDKNGIGQEQHERLCAYVFGELAGAERAAFEAELLRSPELQAERARLTATIGLVKRAIPDEGLPADVRREILASARRGRFRFLRGRMLATVAAAAVLLVGAAAALRWFARDARPFGVALTDGGAVARNAVAPAASRQVEEHSLGAPLGEAMATSRADTLEDGVAREQAQPSAGEPVQLVDAATLEAIRGLGYTARGEEHAAELAQKLALEKEAQLDLPALAYAGEVEEQAEVVSLGYGIPEAAPSPPTETAQDMTFFPPAEAKDGFAALASPGPASPASGPGSAGQPTLVEPTGKGGAAQGVAPEGYAARRAGIAAKSRNVEPPAAPAAQGLFRGTGDTKAPASTPAATVARELAAKAPASAGDDEDDHGDSWFLGQGARREPVAVQRSPADVAAEAERLLDGARPLAGESPSAMFFRYWGDSPFVATAEQPLSTFAVDVDTASYAIARSYLKQGTLPPREAVRTEEFVNYFRADQPAPTDGKPFAIGLELAPSPFASDLRAELLRVTVRGRDVESFQRQPLALTFVIDVSGSMREGGRLELVKRSLTLLLRELYPSDAVGIVAFSNSAREVSPMVSAANRGALEGAILGLAIEGGTNVEAGLRQGYALAAAGLTQNAVNRVILCSDGVGNIGETQGAALLALVKEQRTQGIYLNTVGVGMGNLNDKVLEELADQGDGLCSYVDSDAEAKRVFVDGLARLVQPIARDVKIQVEFDPAQVESWRQLGYENRALAAEDFRKDEVDAGEVNAGHQVTALYELVRVPRDGGALATVRVRYKPPFAVDRGDAAARARVQAEQALEIERALHASAALPAFASASAGFRRSVLVAEFAEVLRRSVHARGDSYSTLLSEAQRLGREAGDPDVTEFVALLQTANPLLDGRAKEDTPRVQALLDQLAELHYRRGLRERTHAAVEPAELEREQAEIARLEGEVRAEVFRANGVQPPTAEERLKGLGYGKDDDR